MHTCEGLVERVKQMSNTTEVTKILRLIPTKHAHVFNVQLNLDSETRYIGTLDEAGEGTFFTKRNQKHIFRKTNSLGINLELMQRPDFHFKWVVIEFDGGNLITSREFFLYHGSVYNFQRAGFEKQLLLGIELFGEERAKAFERTLCHQEELFSEEAA